MIYSEAMKINKTKIQNEMARQELTLDAFGHRFNPIKSRQAVWYDITHARTLRIIDKIAKALGVSGKDFLE
jgi:hypothetical protein